MLQDRQRTVGRGLKVEIITRRGWHSPTSPCSPCSWIYSVGLLLSRWRHRCTGSVPGDVQRNPLPSCTRNVKQRPGQWIAVQLNIQITHFMWGGTRGRSYTIFFCSSFINVTLSEKSIKIDPHLREFWRIMCVPHFLRQCIHTSTLKKNYWSIVFRRLVLIFFSLFYFQHAWLLIS